jgi:hypothetical protein
MHRLIDTQIRGLAITGRLTNRLTFCLTLSSCLTSYYDDVNLACLLLLSTTLIYLNNGFISAVDGTCIRTISELVDAQTHVLAPQSTGTQTKSVRATPSSSASSSSSFSSASADSSSKHSTAPQTGFDNVYSSYHHTASRAYEVMIGKELERSLECRDRDRDRGCKGKSKKCEGTVHSVSTGSGSGPSSGSEDHALISVEDLDPHPLRSLADEQDQDQGTDRRTGSESEIKPHAADVAALLEEMTDKIVRACEAQPNEGGGEGDERSAPTVTAKAAVPAKDDTGDYSDTAPRLKLESSTAVPSQHNGQPQPSVSSPSPSPHSRLASHIAAERRAGQVVCLDYLYLTLECGLFSQHRPPTSTAVSTSSSTSRARGRPTCSDGTSDDGGQGESNTPDTKDRDCSDAERQGSLPPSHASTSINRAESQVGGSIGLNFNALNRTTVIAAVGGSFTNTASSPSRVTEKSISVQQLEEKLEKNLKSSKKRKKEKSGTGEKGKENQSRSPSFSVSGSPCPRKVPRESIDEGSPSARLPLPPKPPSPSPPRQSHSYIPAIKIEKYSMFSQICSFYEEDRKKKRSEGDSREAYFISFTHLFNSLLPTPR